MKESLCHDSGNGEREVAMSANEIARLRARLDVIADYLAELTEITSSIGTQMAVASAVRSPRVSQDDRGDQ